MRKALMHSERARLWATELSTSTNWPETGFGEISDRAVSSGLLATRRLKNARSWRNNSITLIFRLLIDASRTEIIRNLSEIDDNTHRGKVSTRAISQQRVGHGICDLRSRLRHFIVGSHQSSHSHAEYGCIHCHAARDTGVLCSCTFSSMSSSEPCRRRTQ
jgi:hypothetical protein